MKHERGTRSWTAAVAILAAWLFSGGVAGAEPVGSWLSDRLPKGLRLHFSNNVRFESVRWFDPGGAGGDPDYSFWGNRLRFGLGYVGEHLELDGTLQYTQLWSLPDDAAAPFGGPLGPGALYFAQNDGDTSPGDLHVKYLSAKLKNVLDLGLSLQVGRFAYTSGVERPSGNRKLDTLKLIRVGERLYGQFGWSHFQRSFDGARLDWDVGNSRLTGLFFRPTQGGFEEDAGRHINDIDVGHAAWTLGPELLPGVSELQLFANYYDDERDISVRVDNTGLGPVDRQDLEIFSLGGHWTGWVDVGPGQADWVLWGAWQFGDWFEQDHDAAALAVEAGYQLNQLPLKPWLRLGFNWGSGDDDADDGDHGTFAQLIPTARKYSLSANYNMQNNQDLFAQLIVFPAKGFLVRADFHYLRLDDSSDLWYLGAGPTQEEDGVFGFAARPSFGEEAWGSVVEVMAQYQFLPNAKIHAYYGHVFGSDVIESGLAADDDSDYFFVEITFHFDALGK